MCGEKCCFFKGEFESPLVFPWEKRFMERKHQGLVFKPFLVYRNRDRYIVVLYRWVVLGRCRFLSNEGKCLIHEYKPLTCNMFPLVIGLDDNTLRISSECPVINNMISELDKVNVSRFFEKEYKCALEAFITLKTIEGIALSNHWERILANNDAIDIGKDEIIDIDELVELHISESWIQV